MNFETIVKAGMHVKTPRGLFAVIVAVRRDKALLRYLANSSAGGHRTLSDFDVILPIRLLQVVRNCSNPIDHAF